LPRFLGNFLKGVKNGYKFFMENQQAILGKKREKKYFQKNLTNRNYRRILLMITGGKI